MADLSVIPASVLRNLSDKLYEKRKNAALEVEGIVKQLAVAGDHDKITAVINLLTTEFTQSPQANHRKGGLIGLAAATVGLTSEAAQHLEQIVHPVLRSFSDQDSRVRYYACEALYNIAKVVRGDFIIFFNDIFDALCKLSADSDANVQSAAHLLDRLVKDIVTESDQFSSFFFSIEEFIPLLRERMNVLNPYVRQFLVGWITVLDSVPDIDMLGFLPDFLDGLFNMLSDSSHEIRQQADSALSEFLQEIKNSPSVDYGRMAEILVQRAGSADEFTRLTAITWINEFVKLGGDQLVPYYADILGAILPCISDKEEKIRVVARETNEELRSIQADPAEGFDVGAILGIARSEWEATRIEALHWISSLLNRHRSEVIPAENIVAASQDSQTTVFAISKTPSEAQIFLEALEQGLGGVILKVEDVEAVLELKDYFDRRDEVSNLLSLTKATVTQVQVAGMGDRVCVDLCILMRPGEGLLVGSFARGLFLVHSECLESNYIASRPFRVNAMFIGDGAKLVRDAFQLTKEKSPCIIFIDEIDAIGTKRFDSEVSGEREVQRTMLELLNQLDGFSSDDRIKVNHEDFNEGIIQVEESVEQSYSYYSGYNGSDKDPQNSGAYVFRPNGTFPIKPEGQVCDTFASQMQQLLGNAIQEDLEPPRSIMEVRSILCKDAPNHKDNTFYY